MIDFFAMVGICLVIGGIVTGFNFVVDWIHSDETPDEFD